MLKGGRIENRWQPMSQRDVVLAEFPLDQLHGGEDRPLRAAGAERRRARHAPCRRRSAIAVLAHRLSLGARAALRRRSPAGTARRSAGTPSRITPPVYSPAIGSMSLPWILVWMSARRRMVLTACSMNSGWPSSTIRIARLPSQKRSELARRQRIGDVQHVERHARVAERVGEPEQLQRADARCCTCRPA